MLVLCSQLVHFVMCTLCGMCYTSPTRCIVHCSMSVAADVAAVTFCHSSVTSVFSVRYTVFETWRGSVNFGYVWWASCVGIWRLQQVTGGGSGMCWGNCHVVWDCLTSALRTHTLVCYVRISWWLQGLLKALSVQQCSMLVAICVIIWVQYCADSSMRNVQVLCTLSCGLLRGILYTLSSFITLMCLAWCVLSVHVECAVV